MNAADRIKNESEAALQSRGIAVNATLPPIELADAKTMASASAVRFRCLALSSVCAVAYGAPREAVRTWTKKYGIDRTFSGIERAFLDGVAPEADIRYQPEAMWELLWVVELLPTIDHFAGCGDRLVHMVPKIGEDPGGFLADDRLRDYEEIWSEADLLYRLHWAVRQASLQGHSSPNGLPEYVTRNRLRAINWVLEPGVGWDEVDVST